MIRVLPVLLCGGAGTRLWPLSRAGFPKQFLSLTGQQSLFQLAAMRLTSLASPELHVMPSAIVMHEDHRFLAMEQLRECAVAWDCALLEPIARNTAPALTLAAMDALANGEDPVMVVSPADQAIEDVDAFIASVRSAVVQASLGGVVVLGVAPTRAETGYGYILARQKAGSAPVLVERFVEKPDALQAQSFLDGGDHYWNAGVFVLKASIWLAALENFRPDVFVATQRAWDMRSHEALFAGRVVRPEATAYAAVPAVSVDFAVMERCPGSSWPVHMVCLEAGWSDLGAWDAVWKSLAHDADANAFQGDVMSLQSRGNLAMATSRLVTLIGVDNLVVIETADAVLVLNKDRCQEVKSVVQLLSDKGRNELLRHRKIHRPWGWYDTVDEGGRFKVKRIQVKPKASLSLQMHHHRAEHWVVVKGTALITLGDQQILLSENQSTYIPLGQRHRLSNPGEIPLEIIEIQSGSYLAEDDIVRLEDDYGR